MKKVTIIATVAVTGLLMLQGALPVFAAQYTVGQKVINTTNRLENQASKAANKQSNNLQTIIARADALITNRLNSLNALLTRTQNDNRLSANEKSTLISNIQTDISGLTALKTKIDADTDAATARADTKTIITKYYVYAAFDPKMRYLIVLNNLQTATANMQALVPQLQNLINTLKSQGKDVSQIQTLLNDVSSQLQTINSTLSADITTVQNIPTTSSPATGTWAKIKSDINTIVRADLAKINSDFKQMRPLFKQLISKPSGTPAPSQSVTPTTAPSGVPVSPSASPAPTQ